MPFIAIIYACALEVSLRNADLRCKYIHCADRKNAQGGTRFSHAVDDLVHCAVPASSDDGVESLGGSFGSKATCIPRSGGESDDGIAGQGLDSAPQLGGTVASGGGIKND